MASSQWSTTQSVPLNVSTAVIAGESTTGSWLPWWASV